MNIDEIVAATEKRLAEIEAEAVKLRAIVATAKGTPAPFVAPTVNPFPFGHPMGFPIVGAQPDFRGWKIDCEPSIPLGVTGGVTIVGLSQPAELTTLFGNADGVTLSNQRCGGS